MPAKKTTKAAAKETKVEEVNAAETVTEVKTEAKKTSAKKTSAKKTSAKAKEPKVNVIIEYQEKNTEINAIVETVKEAYKADGNADTIETIDIYFQPENSIAYYVVNGKAENKSVDL